MKPVFPCLANVSVHSHDAISLGKEAKRVWKPPHSSVILCRSECFLIWVCVGGVGRTQVCVLDSVRPTQPFDHLWFLHV